MKMYVAQEQMQMVGKAWEIRHHLRQLHKLHQGQITLHALLKSQTTDSSKNLKTP